MDIGLRNTINQPDLINIYRTLHLTAECTFFSSKRDHILGHKTKLNKFKRIPLCLDYILQICEMKLEINNRKITKISKCFVNKQALLNNALSKQNSQRKLKNTVN